MNFVFWTLISESIEFPSWLDTILRKMKFQNIKLNFCSIFSISIKWSKLSFSPFFLVISKISTNPHFLSLKQKVWIRCLLLFLFSVHFHFCEIEPLLVKLLVLSFPEYMKKTDHTSNSHSQYESENFKILALWFRSSVDYKLTKQQVTFGATTNNHNYFKWPVCFSV